MTTSYLWSKSKSRLTQLAVGLVALLVFSIIMLGGGSWLWHTVDHLRHHDGSDVTTLVEQLQHDICEVNNSNPKWQVKQATVEINFVTKTTTASGSETKTELVSAKGELGSESENAHKLVLIIARSPEGDVLPNAKTGGSPFSAPGYLTWVAKEDKCD
ncbi:MAG: hypothetical protein WB952_03485 [Terriglobales bacterium]